MKILLSTFVLSSLVAGVALFSLNENHTIATVVQSSELGLVELSPRGEAGGYAMPASGCSVVHSIASATSDCAIATGYACIPTPPALPTGFVHECSSIVDLTVAHASAYSGIADGDSITVPMTVNNTGTDTYSNTFARAMIDIGNDGIGSLADYSGRSYDVALYIGTKPGVAPGGSSVFTTLSGSPWFAVEGTHAIGIRVDQDNVIDELDEENNRAPWETFTVGPAPAVFSQLSGRNETQGGAAQNNDFTILPTDDISLSWGSLNATGCTGSGFGTGGATSGTQTTVTEPADGLSITYSVTCTAADSTQHSSSLTVSAASNPPLINSNKRIIRKGEDIVIDWDPNGQPGCTLSSQLTGDPSVVGNESVTPQTTSTFTITCGASEDSIEVQVLPVIFES